MTSQVEAVGSLDAQPMDRVRALDARNLYKSFGGVHATQDVSMHVHDREIVGLIGPNGSGKSTLLNVLAGFDRGDAGQIILHGENITGASANHVARRGLVRSWQDPRIIGPLTVRQNIELGALAVGKRTSAITQDLLGMFALEDVSGQPAGALPYGKQKMVALARTLAAGPKVLMLDEPLAGLSIPEQQQMVGHIRAFQKRGSVVIVDHAFGVIVKLCDRVVVLNAGRKLAEGTPDAILANRRVSEVYLG